MTGLNQEQFYAFQLIQQGHSILLTGQAGTGKSFLIKTVEKVLSQKGKHVAVTATTGVAARLFKNGLVIHSWGGILDGRYSNSQVIDRLQLDEQKQIANNIKKVDTLIIDEISMLSMKTFEQLEFVCRTIRGSPQLFGGIQVICVGDFYQLPPVPNDLYHDPGILAFKSEIFLKCVPHKVVLTQVVRQTEIDLITAVNELEMGCPSQSTNSFLNSLKRPITEKISTFLYGTNFEVDCHNAEEMESIIAEEYTYHSVETVERKYLRKLAGKQVLRLKLSCPVVLLCNLSSSLSNGTMGTIIKLEDDGPTVKLWGLVVKLSRHCFSAFSPDQHCVLAERHQYPVAPAFALTVHKAQGSTLENLVIDCRNMVQPGQLGVALGRAVKSSGIQLLNYTPKASRTRRSEIDNFLKHSGEIVKSDLTCCKQVLEIIYPQKKVTRNSPTTFEKDSEESFSSDDERDILAVEELEKDIQKNVDGQYEAPVDVTIFTKEEAADMLNSLQSEHPATENQEKMNQAIQHLKENMHNVIKYLDFNYLQVSKLHTECGLSKGYSVKPTSDFLRGFHSYISSEGYRMSCKELFPETETFDLITGHLITLIRKKVVIRASKSTGTQSIMHVPEEMAEVAVSAHGKIGYVGGRAIAKTKHRHMAQVKRTLERTGKLESYSGKLKVSLLQWIIISEAELMETSKYWESLTDTKRKQNLRGSLTNIVDEAFEFFLMLEKKRLPLYKAKKDLPVEQAEDILCKVVQSIIKDRQLYDMWIHLFKDVNTSVLSSTEKSNECSSIISDMITITMAITDLYGEIINSYLNVTDAEYRKRLSEEFGKKSTMEHRKQILTKTGVSKLSGLSFSSILDDESEMKNKTHYKLKLQLMESKQALNAFTKSELQVIAKGYGIQMKSSLKKVDMTEVLSSCILKCNTMPHPEEICKAGPKVDHPQTTEQESKKRKCKTSSKGKGKARKPRIDVALQETHEDDSDLCALCGKMYYVGDPDPWIGCSSCDKWWHRSCSGIPSTAMWEFYSKDEIDWNCPMCMCMKK